MWGVVFVVVFCRRRGRHLAFHCLRVGVGSILVAVVLRCCRHSRAGGRLGGGLPGSKGGERRDSRVCYLESVVSATFTCKAAWTSAVRYWIFWPERQWSVFVLVT